MIALKRLSLGAVVMIFLGGCVAETGVVTRAGKTPEEIRLEEAAAALNRQSNNIIVRNTLQGAAVGAAAGCALGLLLGGDAEDCARGAVAGGLVGGVGGNAAGRTAAAANQEIVQRETVLANLRQTSSGLNTVERQLRTVISSQNAEIRSLQRQAEAGQISEGQLTSRVRSINSNRTAVSRSLERSENGMANAARQLQQASARGQGNLGSLQNAAVSNQNRIARTRETISLIGR